MGIFVELLSGGSNKILNNTIKFNRQYLNYLSTHTYLDNLFLYNLMHGDLNVSGRNVWAINDLVTFNISVSNINGTACTEFTVNDLYTRPNEIVSYSTSGNNITGNFTVSRSGLYSLVADVTCDNRIKTKYTYLVNSSNEMLNYYFRGNSPTHSQPIGNGNDVGKFLLDPPTTNETKYCAQWVQNFIDEYPQQIFGLIQMINISVWYKATGTPYLHITKFGVYDSTSFDYLQEIPSSTITIFNSSVNFTNLNWMIDYPGEWNWIDVKLTGTNPYWQSNSTHPSYVNITYNYTTTPEIKSITNDEIMVLSATSPVSDTNQANITIEGSGTTNITVKMLNTALKYNVSLDDQLCDNMNCNISQTNGELNLSLSLSSEHQIFIYTAANGKLIVNLIAPPAGTTTNQDQNTTFNVNASVTCRDADCGTVYGTIRYNASSANPDTAVSEKKGSTPFYILDNLWVESNDTSYTGWLKNGTAPYLGDIDWPNNYINATNNEDGNVIGNYYFQKTSQGGGTVDKVFLDILYSHSIVFCSVYVYLYNGSAWWYVGEVTSMATNTWLWYTFDVSTNFTTTDSINSAQMNLTAHCAYSDNWIAVDAAKLRVTYKTISPNVTAMCGSLNNGQSCQLNWTVNATGNFVNAYKIGVLFNSSYASVTQNHTDNATIRIIECTHSRTLSWSSIDFSNLNPNTAGSSNAAPGNTNKLYNISNTGTCRFQVWINGSDLINTTYNTQINVGNITWHNRTNDFTTSYGLNKTYSLLNASLTPAMKNLTTYYWLAVPPIIAGKYNGTLIICTNTTQQSGQNEVC
jgi:hypothetical protein